MSQIFAPSPHLLTRRSVLRAGLATCAVSALPASLSAFTWNVSAGRPATGDRRFTSPVIESTVEKVSKAIPDPILRSMFERCFTNTLDTTVFPGSFSGKPDTFVITGDIDAMWLRDSAAQVHPYLKFARQDQSLASLIQGVVRRQTRMVLIDPYANAFTRNPSDPPLKWAVHDDTVMKPGVAERKWEVDSLCYVLRLAYGYWRATGDTSPFDSEWRAAARSIVQTFREQQRFTGPGPYSFTRLSSNPYDTVPLNGFGNPAKPIGMIFSMFRPSDDSCVYPLFVPANLFAVASLAKLQELAAIVEDHELVGSAGDLLNTVRDAVRQYGHVNHPEYGTILAYEVDGFGNSLMMDDANAPSLLSLPYLDSCSIHDLLYQRTRQFVLSSNNPYFFEGTSAQGIGSPHTGSGQIWPMGIILRALTSTNDHEIVQCLRWLRNTTAGTDFMHESFDANNPSVFTRPWFAWANTLFGELILQLAGSRPQLLRQVN